jgi:hypothetical protein
MYPNPKEPTTADFINFLAVTYLTFITLAVIAINIQNGTIPDTFTWYWHGRIFIALAVELSIWIILLWHYSTVKNRPE